MKKQTLILIAIPVLTICFAIGFYVMGWDTPTDDPPGGNISLPLNTGYAGQSKAGGLTIHTSSSFTPGRPENALLVPYGNVGIGTATPNTELHIVGRDMPGGGNADLILQGRAINPGDISVKWDLVSVSADGRFEIHDLTSTSSDSMFDTPVPLRIEKGTPEDTLYLSSTGNVGIGEHDPQAKLDVNGNMKFDGQKVCDVFDPGNFNSPILVPSSWTAATCKNFMSSVGAFDYQLGCIFQNSFSWGGAIGAGPVKVPAPNCGW